MNRRQIHFFWAFPFFFILSIHFFASASSFLSSGKTVDFHSPKHDPSIKGRSWIGRAFVHNVILQKKMKSPLVVFLHGINPANLKNMWFGGGKDDLRPLFAELIQNNLTLPMIVAAPSSIDTNITSFFGSSWPDFDLDHFIDQLSSHLQGQASIDISKVIVVVHSGAGCHMSSGIASILKSKTNVYSYISIDTCMQPELVDLFSSQASNSNVIVSWQTDTWKNRPFIEFERKFNIFVKSPANPNSVYRVLDQMKSKVLNPHDEIVSITLRKWLPLLIPPGN